MRRSNRYEFNRDLKKFKNDTAKFKELILKAMKDKYTIGFEDYKLIGKYCPKELSDDKEYVETYGKKVAEDVLYQLKKVNTKPKTPKQKYRFTYGYRMGNTIPQAINANKNVIPKEVRKSLIKKALTYSDAFYSYGKQAFIDIAFDWLQEEKEIIWLANNYLKIMSKKQQDHLFKKVSLSQLSKEIQLKFKKSPAQMAKQYRKVSDWSNTENREAFVKDMANSPGLMKLVDFNFTITKKDLASLPPMTRYNFLQHLFEQKIWAARYAKDGRSAILNICNYINKIQWAKYIDVEDLSKDDIQELVMVAAFRKNQEVQNWVEYYCQFLDLRDKVREELEIMRSYL